MLSCFQSGKMHDTFSLDARSDKSSTPRDQMIKYVNCLPVLALVFSPITASQIYFIVTVELYKKNMVLDAGWFGIRVMCSNGETYLPTRELLFQ